MNNPDTSTDAQTRTILDYYSKKGPIQITHASPEMLVGRYLAKVMTQEEWVGKTILELGAGCSQYIPVFLGGGCKRYYANELIRERLEVVRANDPRYNEVPGDFRSIELPEKVDIVLASLVMMYLVPMHDEFVWKIGQCLKPGGVFLSMDPNYFCPLSIGRRFSAPTPARIFNPCRFANRFRRNGFVIEKLVPFTAPLPWTTGNWLLGHHVLA